MESGENRSEKRKKRKDTVVGKRDGFKQKKEKGKVFNRREKKKTVETGGNC